MEFLEKLKGLMREMEEEEKSDTVAQEKPILITRYGRKFEQLFLGFTLPDDVNLVFDEYLDFHDALEEMKGIQPEGYDPSNPSEGCNREFFQAVKSFMLVGGNELQYFISVGTKMDYWHGADAIFSWRGVTVTVDVTVDPEKKYKADFCISPEDVESGEVYDSIAKGIAMKLVSRYLFKVSQYSVHGLLI